MLRLNFGEDLESGGLSDEVIHCHGQSGSLKKSLVYLLKNFRKIFYNKVVTIWNLDDISVGYRSEIWGLEVDNAFTLLINNIIDILQSIDIILFQHLN